MKDFSITLLFFQGKYKIKKIKLSKLEKLDNTIVLLSRTEFEILDAELSLPF